MTKGRKTRILVLLFIMTLIYFYQYSPWRIEFLGYYDKVFAHRVNSLEKLEASLKYFNGIELDLVYNENDNVLDVNHPPAKSIGLNFETYLNKIDEKNLPFLWLDIKHLDASNNDAILLKLNTLLEKKKYPKNKILIESPKPESLDIFSKEGYKISYYLKPKINNMSSQDLKKEIKHIQSVIENQPSIGLSSNYQDYNVLKTYFPDNTKYLWATSSVYKLKYKKKREILKDSTVAIVLSSYKSFSGNR